MHGLPLDAGGEARTAAAAQAGLGDVRDDGRTGEAQCLLQALEAAVLHVIRDGDRIGDAGAREGEALLVLQVGVILDVAEAQLVRASRGNRERGDVLDGDRAIGDAAVLRFHLDEGFEEQEAARAVADHLVAELREGGGHFVSADRAGGGIAWNEDLAHERHSATIVSNFLASTRPTSLSSTITAGDSAQLPRQ